ncbi:MAG: sacsin N-terminal ATP-binding-like domain-containing protein, partial [Sphingomonadaceae bacterium]
MDGPDWFDDLRAMRLRGVAALKENDFERGIWNATVAKYADPTHFIFELLQNAEDEGATRASFTLEPQAIVFEHDGGDFRREDVVGITGLGNTTKLNETNKIGRFGIGFKSVFVVTAAPEIHTLVDGQPLAFQIQDLVVPRRIGYAGHVGRTRIVLPLSPEDGPGVVELVRQQLRTVGPRSMLFLQNVS